MDDVRKLDVERLLSSINIEGLTDPDSEVDTDREIARLADMIGWYRRCLIKNGVTGELASELIQNLHGRIIWHDR